MNARAGTAEMVEVASTAGGDEISEECGLLEDLVCAMVDFPQQVRVEEQGRETTTSMFVIHTHPDDRGKVIGRSGHNVEALRTLFGSIAAAQRRRVLIEVADSRMNGAPVTRADVRRSR